MASNPLDLIRQHVDAIEAMGFDENATLPDPPDLSRQVLDADDIEQAEALLARLHGANERLHGMQTRLRGEIEAARRPTIDRSRPAPRVLDTTA